MIGITGSSGVIGRILCDKLRNASIDFSTFSGDIRDEIAVMDWVVNFKLTYIIHLASKVAVSDVENNIGDAYDVNISGTINLIKAIKKHHQPIGFFYASTSHVYQSSDKALKESDIINPINSYGLTKWMSELLLNDFKKKYPQMTLCIGRIFSFYHDSQQPPFLYPNLMKRFQEEDLSQPFNEGTVNIASGKSIKIIDFAQKIAPQKIDFDFDITEKGNHLNADISLLNTILSENE
jgi:nucleoside-diphosphate-sugar epimerase